MSRYYYVPKLICTTLEPFITVTLLGKTIFRDSLPYTRILKEHNTVIKCIPAIIPYNMYGWVRRTMINVPDISADTE